MAKSLRVGIGCDLAGYSIKKHLIEVLTDQGYIVDDVGCEPDLSVADYPVYARMVGEGVALGKYDRGILICGTGQGMVIAANKIKGVRAALCLDVLPALFSREHNDANVLCMGGWMIDNEKAEKVSLAWLKMAFAEGVHSRRVKMIDDIENEQ